MLRHNNAFDIELSYTCYQLPKKIITVVRYHSKS